MSDRLRHILDGAGPWLAGLAAALTAIGAAVTALWTSLRAPRKTKAEVEQLDALAEEKRALAYRVRTETGRDLFEQVMQLRVLALQASEEAATYKTKCADLEARVRALEAILPAAFSVEIMTDLGIGKKILDRISDPLLLTSKVGQGTILYANPAFCRAMGRTLEEILALGWRGMCHPDHLEDTEGVEASAWGADVDGFVNSFVRADGARVWLRWLCSTYSKKRGVTLAYVEVERVDPPPVG